MNDQTLTIDKLLSLTISQQEYINKLKQKIKEMAEVINLRKKKYSPVEIDEDGNWFFWNETWTERIGNFDSNYEAHVALSKYCKELDGE